MNLAAFQNNKHLTKISLPRNLKIIRQRVFANCVSVEDIVIPESVQSIREGAFQWCSKLTRVYLPQTLQSIDRDAFYGCQSLININANNVKKEVNLPSNIRYLDYGAFNDTPINKVVRDMTCENKIHQYPGQVFDQPKTK